jgi:hypothetical protein
MVADQESPQRPTVLAVQGIDQRPFAVVLGLSFGDLNAHTADDTPGPGHRQSPLYRPAY